MTTAIQIRSKGSLTLPMELRRKYGLNEGDIFTLIDLGDGAFMLTPNASTVARLGDRVADLLSEQNVPVDEVLQALDEERQRYYQERYVQK
ncbi:MAG TPA: AbrB/MazE/SpoVT family DNA-binding domain-containing protein [Anaerolineales bacterium]|nr:AbrB/MazE/SpoVT family DNA-binding domain-containing protein [Anaerolineales bacterium]